MMSCARPSGVDDLASYVACSPFVHKNGSSGIWQNRQWPLRAPAAWMTNSHPYRLHIYTELEQYRIESRSIFKNDKAMMSQWSACRFMTIYHAGMCSMWIEWLCIPRRPNLLIPLLHYLNIIVQPTKLTAHVRYSNHVMSPHIKKNENWNESIMLLFFQCTTYPKKWKFKWEYYVIIF